MAALSGCNGKGDISRSRCRLSAASRESLDWGFSVASKSRAARACILGVSGCDEGDNLPGAAAQANQHCRKGWTTKARGYLQPGVGVPRYIPTVVGRYSAPGQ